MPCDALQADGMTLAAVGPAFSMFHVDRVAGQVPVNDPVTVGMPIQTFLHYQRRGQHEGLERGVEGRSRPRPCVPNAWRSDPAG